MCVCVCLSSSMQFATLQLIKVGHVHAKPSALSMIPQYSCNKSVTNCFQATNPPQPIWNRRKWTKLTMATAETSLQRWLNAYLEVIWQNNTWNTPLLDTMVIKQWNTEISISCNWFWYFWIYVANSCRPSVCAKSPLRACKIQHTWSGTVAYLLFTHWFPLLQLPNINLE